MIRLPYAVLLALGGYEVSQPDPGFRGHSHCHYPLAGEVVQPCSKAP